MTMGDQAPITDDPRVVDLVNKILYKVDAQHLFWISDGGGSADLKNEAYNRGVSAATDAVVRVLLAHGFAAVLDDDEADSLPA